MRLICLSIPPAIFEDIVRLDRNQCDYIVFRPFDFHDLVPGDQLLLGPEQEWENEFEVLCTIQSVERKGDACGFVLEAKRELLARSAYKDDPNTRVTEVDL